MAETGDIQNNGVNIIIENIEKKILMVRHNYRDKKWSLPGGGIRQGETSIKAVIRESLEETGLTIIRPTLIADVNLAINWRHKVLLFLATQWQGHFKPMDINEISDLRFMYPTNILGDPEIYPAQEKLIKIFITASRLGLKMPVFAIASDPPVIESS